MMFFIRLNAFLAVRLKIEEELLILETNFKKYPVKKKHFWGTGPDLFGFFKA